MNIKNDRMFDIALKRRAFLRMGIAGTSFLAAVAFQDIRFLSATPFSIHH